MLLTPVSGSVSAIVFASLLGGLVLPPLHGKMIHEHDDQGQPEQADNHINTEIVCIMKLFKLRGKKIIFVLLEFFGVSRAVHVGGDF